MHLPDVKYAGMDEGPSPFEGLLLMNCVSSSFATFELPNHDSEGAAFGMHRQSFNHNSKPHPVRSAPYKHLSLPPIATSSSPSQALHKGIALWQPRVPGSASSEA
jgi:hypothetical protein